MCRCPLCWFLIAVRCVLVLGSLRCFVLHCCILACGIVALVFRGVELLCCDVVWCVVGLRCDVFVLW